MAYARITRIPSIANGNISFSSDVLCAQFHLGRTGLSGWVAPSLGALSSETLPEVDRF